MQESVRGSSNTLRRIVFLASGMLAGLGYVSSLRAGMTMFHLFPPLYLVPVLVWPSYQGMRFLVPIVPFYFCFCLLGVRRIDAVMQRRRHTRNAVLTVFVAAVAASYAGRYSTVQFGELREGIAKQESRELFDFVTAATGRDDVLVFSRPRVLALMTAPESFGYPRDTLLSRIGVDDHRGVGKVVRDQVLERCRLILPGQKVRAEDGFHWKWGVRVVRRDPSDARGWDRRTASAAPH